MQPCHSQCPGSCQGPATLSASCASGQFRLATKIRVIGTSSPALRTSRRDAYAVRIRVRVPSPEPEPEPEWHRIASHTWHSCCGQAGSQTCGAHSNRINLKKTENPESPQCKVEPKIPPVEHSPCIGHTVQRKVTFAVECVIFEPRNINNSLKNRETNTEHERFQNSACASIAPRGGDGDGGGWESRMGGAGWWRWERWEAFPWFDLLIELYATEGERKRDSPFGSPQKIMGFPWELRIFPLPCCCCYWFCCCFCLCFCWLPWVNFSAIFIFSFSPDCFRAVPPAAATPAI